MRFSPKFSRALPCSDILAMIYHTNYAHAQLFSQNEYWNPDRRAFYSLEHTFSGNQWSFQSVYSNMTWSYRLFCSFLLKIIKFKLQFPWKFVGNPLVWHKFHPKLAFDVWHLKRYYVTYNSTLTHYTYACTDSNTNTYARDSDVLYGY